MTYYQLQVQTKDFGLQLKTECVANTLEELFFEAKKMVKSNISKVKGLSFRVWKIENKHTTFLKESIINGC